MARKYYLDTYQNISNFATTPIVYNPTIYTFFIVILKTRPINIYYLNNI